MSKVITFSRHFQKGHPRAGEPTHFVEKIWESTILYYYEHLPDEFESYIHNTFPPKLHTIRAGNRFKVGDKFSPRVWSGKPYASKQIVIAPDLEVKKVYEIEIFETQEIYIDGVYYGSYGSYNAATLANNDGLDVVAFHNWFTKLPFKGQIICWSDLVNY